MTTFPVRQGGGQRQADAVTAGDGGTAAKDPSRVAGDPIAFVSDHQSHAVQRVSDGVNGDRSPAVDTGVVDKYVEDLLDRRSARTYC